MLDARVLHEVHASMPRLNWLKRFFLAFLALFKVWFSRDFAEGVWALQHGQRPQLPPAEPAAAPTPAAAAQAPKPERPIGTEAIRFLAVLQRDGRLIDFLQEDLTGASDADIAAVVRSTIYEGCRKSLAAHIKLAPVLDKPEGSQVTVEAGFDPSAIRLAGNVVGSPPFRGTLKHRGWRATEVTLPESKGDPKIVAPAEVELA